MASKGNSPENKIKFLASGEESFQDNSDAIHKTKTLGIPLDPDSFATRGRDNPKQKDKGPKDGKVSSKNAKDLMQSKFMKTGGSLSGKKGPIDLNKTFSVRQKESEKDLFTEFAIEPTTVNSTQIHLKRLYRQRCTAKRVKRERVKVAQREASKSRDAKKKEKIQANATQVKLRNSSQTQALKTQKSKTHNNYHAQNKQKTQALKSGQQLLAQSSSQRQDASIIKQRSMAQNLRHVSIQPVSRETQESPVGKSSISGDCVSALSPPPQNYSPNKFVNIKNMNHDQSLSRISQDYSIDSIESLEESVKHRPQRIDNEGLVESRSGINIENINKQQKSTRNDPNTDSGISPGVFDKKRYNRQMTNVVNNQSPKMLLNVSYEKKVKLSSTKGRKVNTRNNSRGDNHSPSKRNLEKTEQYRPVNNRDSLSNGPSDLNKKLKILTTRNRCSADLISNSVISKKEMKKLEREQRIYELYMKAPYKLMDKQQGERAQRKLDMDFLHLEQKNGKPNEIDGSRTGSSYFANKRQTMNSLMSQERFNDSTLKKNPQDTEEKKRNDTTKNLNYLQQVFEKRHQEDKHTYQQNYPHTTRNISKMSQSDKKYKMSGNSPGSISLLHKNSPANEIIYASKMPRQLHGGTRKILMPSDEHIVVEVEQDFTPHDDVLKERSFGQAVKYHSQMKPVVDKSKAQRKNTWGSSQDYKTKQYGSGRNNMKHQYNTGKKPLQDTQLSCVETGDEYLSDVNKSGENLPKSRKELDPEAYKRRLAQRSRIPALQESGFHSAAKVHSSKYLSPLAESRAYDTEMKIGADPNAHINKVYGRNVNSSMVNMAKLPQPQKTDPSQMQPDNRNKYVNNRIYDQPNKKGQQTTAQPTGEMPSIFDNEVTRPKFLGGQFVNKVSQNATSEVKNYLQAQQRVPADGGNELVQQYYKNKLRLRNNLDNIYKSKGGSPVRKTRHIDDVFSTKLPTIDMNEAGNVKKQQALEFEVASTPNKLNKSNNMGSVSIKKQLQYEQAPTFSAALE